VRRGPLLAAVLVAVLAGTACEQAQATGAPTPPPAPQAVTSWVDQLQNYPGGTLDEIVRAPQQLAVVDLARDAGADYFRPDEIAAVRASGKIVLGYFEIGSAEDYRPETGPLGRDAPDLLLNRWPTWPAEQFVKYWDPRWWDRVIRPRLDQALAAGFDGVFLDTPLAYEELDLALVPGRTRPELARDMADLVIRMSGYAKARHPGFMIVPLNSPELREQSGYVEAIDGVGIESPFYLPTDRRCDFDYCPVNLDHARALRDAGKLVLAVDYATRPDTVRDACAQYRAERFAGYIGPPYLDSPAPPCP
jgi:cysteinyl-tRNA synthetase